MGEKGNSEVSPRKQHIELKVPQQNFLQSAFLALQLLKLTIQISVQQKSRILPAISPNSCQLHLYHQGVIFSTATMQSLGHLASLQEMISWKFFIT